MPKKHIQKSTIQKIQAIALQYRQGLRNHSALVKRALFTGPKRIIGSDHTVATVATKIKSFFSRLSPSMWILAGSVAFLAYAVWGVVQRPDSNKAVSHNSADENKTDDIQSDTALNQYISRSQIIESDTMMKNYESHGDTIDTQQATGTNHYEVITTDTPATDAYTQVIYDFYGAINTEKYNINDYFDSYMRTSDLVRSYFTASKMTALINKTINGIEIVQAKSEPADRNDRMQVSYTISYTLLDNQQSFTEDWVVTLRNQGGWKIGTMRCETKGCSTHPIFQPSRYGIR